MGRALFPIRCINDLCELNRALKFCDSRFESRLVELRLMIHGVFAQIAVRFRLADVVGNALAFGAFQELQFLLHLLEPFGRKEDLVGHGSMDYDTLEPVVRVSVIVVSYNTRDLLRRCLSALTDVHEVVVIDNASSDGSAEMVSQDFPAVTLIRNEINRGFGAANNQGLEVMSGDVALLLNSDAFPSEGAISRLGAVMNDDRWIACGGRLQNPDGSTQNSCSSKLTLWAVICEQSLLEKLLPNSRLFSPYWQTQRLMGKSGEVHEVEQVMGACLMMRPVERFDDDFFLFCEDTELCRRLRRHGEIAWVKDAVFTHELGASSTGARWTSVARYNRGKELYFLKHHGRAAMAFCWYLDRKGALLRLILWGVPTLLTLGLVERLRRQSSLFLKVLFAPSKGPASPTGRY